MKFLVWKSLNLNEKEALSALLRLKRFSRYKADYYYLDSSIFLGYLKFVKEPYKKVHYERNTSVFIDGYVFNPEFIDVKTPIKEARNLKPFLTPSEFLINYFNNGSLFIKGLNGSFVIVIYNHLNGEIKVINDRYASRPIFYYFNKKEFILTSEPKAFPHDIFKIQSINWKSVASFLSFRQLFGFESLITNINLLKPGSILTFRKNRIHQSQYFNINKHKEIKWRSEDKLLEKASTLYKNAIIKSAYAADYIGNIITPLSGGYDTRLICSLLKRYEPEIQIKTLSTDKELLPTPLDSIIADKIAKLIKVPNKSINLPDSLWKDYMIKGVYLLDGLATEHIWFLPFFDSISETGVALDGYSGDVLARTSESIVLNKPKGVSNKIYAENLANFLFPRDPRNNLLGRFMVRTTHNLNSLTSLFRSPLFDFLVKNQQTQLVNFIKTIDFNSKSLFTKLVSSFSINNSLYLSQNLLGRKLFVIYPYLENQLFDFLLSIPNKTKVKIGFTRKVLNMLVPNVMNIESTNDLNIKGKYMPQSRDFIFLNKETTVFLKDLVRSLEKPPFIKPSKTEFINYAEKLVEGRKTLTDISFFEFLIWYNIFVKNKNLTQVFF